MKMKHYKKALEDFTLAIEIKPDFSIAYLNRGIAFRSDGKIEEAVIDFNKFLNLQNGKDSNTSQVRNWIKKLGYEPEH
jgi:tetratricopeptide (TPR) repeat protein